MLYELPTALGEDFQGPTPATLTFLASSTTNLDTQCTDISIRNDANYEGTHSFVAEIGAVTEPSVLTNSTNTATVSIQDDGMGLRLGNAL